MQRHPHRQADASLMSAHGEHHGHERPFLRSHLKPAPPRTPRPFQSLDQRQQDRQRDHNDHLAEQGENTACFGRFSAT